MLANWLTNRAADLRYALRMIRKTPGASGIAVLSLALGIGANTAIFSLVDTMLLKLLPVRSPQELFIVTTGERAVQHLVELPRLCRDARPEPRIHRPGVVQRRADAAWDANGATRLQRAHGADPGLMVSGNYFEVLGVEPAIGHLFTAEVDRAPGAAPYAVLNYDYWRSRFQGDPGVLGRVLRLNGYPMTIVGVARRGFRSMDVSVGPNMYVPAMMRSEVTGMPLRALEQPAQFLAPGDRAAPPGSEHAAGRRRAAGDLQVAGRGGAADGKRPALRQ